MADELRNQMSNFLNNGQVNQAQTIVQQQLPDGIMASAGLPPLSDTFTGRQDVLDDCVKHLDPERTPHQRPLLITGMAGVGKTEVAKQIAHRLSAELGRYSHVVFIDMSGYDRQHALSATQALETLLLDLGLPAHGIPQGEQNRRSLYRTRLSELAAQGQRVLVVIDNVADPAHVKSLLPSQNTAGVLLTSRTKLSTTLARQQDLKMLDYSAARKLLREAVQYNDEEDGRIDAEPEAATEVAKLCGCLPLALRICASILSTHPHWTVKLLAEKLAKKGKRLSVLDDGADPVRSAFELSYQHLPPDPARLFRLLSLCPGRDFSLRTAAYLLDEDGSVTDDHMDTLYRAHMVEARSVADRFRMHDLLRLYSDECGDKEAAADRRPRARSRLVAYYRDDAQDADLHLETLPIERTARFRDRVDALEWLSAEHESLTALATGWRTSSDSAEDAVAIGFSLMRFFDHRGHVDDRIAVSEAIVDAARELDDPLRLGFGLSNLGCAYAETGFTKRAITSFNDALAIFGEHSDEGLAITLTNAGSVLADVLPREQIVGMLEDAIGLFEEIGALHSAANAMTNLAGNLRHPDDEADLVRSEELYRRAAGIYQEEGDIHGQGLVAHNLGGMRFTVDDTEGAIAEFGRAIGFYGQIRDHEHEAQSLLFLALVHYEAGANDEAIRAAARAAELDRASHRHVHELEVQNMLAEVLTAADRPDEAAAARQRAEELRRELSGDGR